VLIHASLKDDNDIQRQLKTLYRAANLKGTLKYIQSGSKRLRVAHSAYPISVRPHQAAYIVRSFIALVRNNWYAFVEQYAS